MKYATGYKPDPASYQREPFHRLSSKLGIAALPDSAFVTPLPLVMDQGSGNFATSACTGHAVAVALYPTLGWLPSPSGLYGNGRALGRSSPSIPLTDDGAEPNQVWRAASAFGVRLMRGPTSDGRFSDAEPATINDEPKLGDLEEEGTSLIIGEYGITSTGGQRVYDVCASVFANKAVTCAIAGGSDVFQNYSGGLLPVLSAPLDHYVCLVAFQTLSDGSKAFRIRNSWGRYWGEQGDCWISEDGLQELGDLVVADVKVSQ